MLETRTEPQHAAPAAEVAAQASEGRACLPGANGGPSWHGCAVVFGKAEGMGSKRIGRNRAGDPIILDDSDAALRSWQNELLHSMLQCRPATPLTSPIHLRIAVYVRRPQAHFGTGRNAGLLKLHAPRFPAGGSKDLDKCCRAAGDVGKKAGWYVDDRQVAHIQAARLYVSGDELERTVVWAQAMALYPLWVGHEKVSP